MLSRRRLLVSGVFAASAALMGRTRAQTTTDEASGPFDQLIYPPIEAIDAPEQFGYQPATAAQKEKAREIIQQTPKGPEPIDIAQSFIDRFSNSDPDAISQWPAPQNWNPLIVSFFNEATTLHVNNDMVEWCAAFANWCIKRAGKTGSNSASSQSFLDRAFDKTNNPKRGNLAIFTCFEKSSNRSLGIGHVAFVQSPPAAGVIQLLGGNTSKDGHSSIICQKPFSTAPREIRRHVNGIYVPCIMRLNTYVALK
ncbi:exported hypothetical protein [Mesorhizobium plurifarium]|uniref:Peptidase C51 domain-containing protein n=1 Tax=Mesorhizobium plurifarium TaxID=69974 RepID=A0A090GED5_MESPL|nr:exported hypothetical protein [Mesorhizobium plurifarium]